MRYLVICKDKSAFFTDWFTVENCWNPKEIRAVADLEENKITFDGCSWKPIDFDTL